MIVTPLPGVILPDPSLNHDISTWRKSLIIGNEMNYRERCSDHYGKQPTMVVSILLT